MAKIIPEVEDLGLIIRLHFKTSAQAWHYEIPKELKKQYTFDGRIQKAGVGTGFYIVGVIKPITTKKKR